MEVMVLGFFDVVKAILFITALLFIALNIISFIFRLFRAKGYKRFVELRLKSIPADQVFPIVKPEEIATICKTLKESYNSCATRPFETRKQILYALYRMLYDNKQALGDAIRKDLHRDRHFSVLETESVIEEVEYLIQNMDAELSDKRVKSTAVQLLAQSFITHEPYGVVCVIAPWNFPINLSLIPVAGALACGNTVFLKLSKYSFNSSKLIAELCDRYIPSEYLRCEYMSGRESIQACCDADFDYYFFTGSTTVGKLVHQAAAKKLVPVTLELGGKNPVIVDKNVDLKTAVKRIAWAKCVNGGQICVCTDHGYVHKDIYDAFCEEVKKCFIQFFGEDAQKSDDYPRMITKDAAAKMKEIIEQSDVFYGGNVDIEDRYVQPTLLKNVKMIDLFMENEIFGPILPIIKYENLEEVFVMIKEHPNPLAAYVFTSDDAFFEKFRLNVNSGALYRNDAIIHLINGNLPFGGNCQSGIGYYPGKFTFSTFSRPRAVVQAHTFIDVPLRYWPFTYIAEIAFKYCAFWEIPILLYL
uniref:Aldehyde dehydrogenase n=1 Tax=Entamoeba invadens TaxID=33085 RepID=S0B1B5_ENTIV|nr:aldehyde dehydrogenase, putative [Entamoeba invadens]